MSTQKPNPEDYDGKITQLQIDQLEEKRIAFAKALETGSADLDDLREDYQLYAISLGIDLSGKLMPSDKPGPPTDTEPPKPSEGTIKDWGGNKDPDTWKVVHMKDPKEKFKVVDGTGKNIAADFTTQENATAYIVYAIWHKYHDLPPPPPPGPGPTGNKDQFGILCIKASAPSNKFETAFKLEEKMRNYASGKPSEWSTEYTNESPSIIQNVEVTIYEQIRGFKSEADTISLKLNGPPHKDGAKFWVIPDFATDGNAKRTLEVEDPHPNNHGINPKPLSEIGGSLIGKWIGYKGISYQKDGKRFVESWIHFPVTNVADVSAEQDKWRQYLPTTDLGSKYLTATGKLTTSRLDGVEKGDPPDFKYASVREITP